MVKCHLSKNKTIMQIMRSKFATSCSIEILRLEHPPVKGLKTLTGRQVINYNVTQSK